MGRYCNHYFEKVTEAIKLKCGYDFHYIIKYVCRKKMTIAITLIICHVNNIILINICYVNNIFRTSCMSPMYSINLAETSHTHRSTIKIR